MDNGVPTFGLWYDFRQRLPLEDYARFYAECLEECERIGFWGVWLSEHHFVDDAYLPSPLVVAAAKAARTTRVRIGTNVFLLPMHHPLRVAEDAAVADLASGGRFVLGVGQGHVQHEFETLGFDRKKRPSFFVKGLEVIRHLWGEGRTGYKGCRRRFRDPPFEPQPTKTPPIYIGAFADGFLASSGGAFGWTCQKIRKALERHGREGGNFPFVFSGVAYVSEDSGQVREEIGLAIAYQRSRYVEWGTDAGKPEPIQTENLPWGRCFVGNPDEVAEGLVNLYRQAPCDHFCFRGRLPSVTYEQALANMRLFASEVAPRVRDAVRP